MQWGGSGQKPTLAGEVQILAIGFFLLRLLMVQFHLLLCFLLLQKSTPIMCPSLSALVVYMKTVSFHSFTHSREHYRFYELSSFSETKARRLIKEAGQDRKGGVGRKQGQVRAGRMGKQMSPRKEGKRASERSGS